MYIKLFGKDEVRRLQKAARENDKRKLAEWGGQFEARVCETLRQEYENMYKAELSASTDLFTTILVYCLVFSEEPKLAKEDIHAFMKDVNVTFDMLRRGELKENEFIEALEKEDVHFPIHNHFDIYKEKQAKLDKLIDEYENKLKELAKGNGISL